jgi:hypothetical protein
MTNNALKTPTDSTICRKSTTQHQLPTLNTKPQLNKIIVNKSGRPDYLAINIYWDTFRSLYNKFKDTPKTKGVYINYKKLSELHGISKECIKRALVKLEKLGLISRSFHQKDILNNSSVNQLIVYLWKDTPHFIAPFGGSRDGIVLQPCTSFNHITHKKHSPSALMNKTPPREQELGGNNGNA